MLNYIYSFLGNAGTSLFFFFFKKQAGRQGAFSYWKHGSDWQRLSHIQRLEGDKKKEALIHVVFLLFKPVTAEAQIRLRAVSYFALEWPPTPVIWPGKFHGQGSLVGYNPWCRKELDVTEQLKRKTQPRLEVCGAKNSEEALQWP